MMKRKAIYLLLTLCIFMSNALCPLSAAADDSDMSVPRGEPHILIANDSWMPEYKAGEKINLSIPIENTGSGSANNVDVSLSVSDPDKFPFKSNKMSYNYHTSSIDPGSTTASFNVTIPPNVKSGTYPITVNISYTTPSGSSGQTSGTVYVKIVNSYRQPLLQCIDVKFDAEKLPAGRSTMINLQMKNDGDLVVQNIELRLSGFSADGISLDKWPDTYYIGKMQAGEIKTGTFKILVDREVKTGTYTLDLNIKYKDEYNQEYTRDSKVYLPVAGKDSQDEFTPRIILESYDCGAGTVIPGTVFPLTLTLANTSETTAVHNIKISLNSDGQVFSPVGNSNSFYVARLDAQGKIQKTLMFKPKANAESQPYNINADIDYQDSKGNKLTEKEVISVPVNQEAKFVLTAVEVPPTLGLDNPQSISVNYHNGGKAIIRNLSLRVEGDFEIKDGEQYLGNLEAGKNDYCDVTVIPHKTGKLNGKIIMDYDDDSGKHFQHSKDFQLQVVKQAEPMPPDGSPLAVPDKKPLWKKFMIPGGIALVIVIAAITYKKRKHAKEEVDFEYE